MPNQYDPATRQIGLRLTEVLYRKFRKKCEQAGTNMNRVIAHLVTDYTADVRLTAQEALEVAEAIRKRAATRH